MAIVVSQPHHSVSVTFYLIVLVNFVRRNPVVGESIVNRDYALISQPPRPE